MKRIIWIAVLTLLFSACSSASTKIAIDVGHSKNHPGAISARGESEFEFNSKLSEEIAEIFSAAGISPVLIGDDGRMDDIHGRTPLASGAKFFLSVHHDSAKPRYFREWQWNGRTQEYADEFSGFGLFVSRKNRYFSQSLKCASAIGAQLQSSGFHHSTYHVDRTAGEGREWADQANGVYYFDDLIVLESATQPAVLLEAGVIVNRNEEAELSRRDVREKIAVAVRAGLASCGVIQFTSGG